MNTYTIKYTLYFKDGSFTNRETNVKNCMSGVHAQVKLEAWLKRKHPEFDRIHVFYCEMEIMSYFKSKYNLF